MKPIFKTNQPRKSVINNEKAHKATAQQFGSTVVMIQKQALFFTELLRYNVIIRVIKFIFKILNFESMF